MMIRIITSILIFQVCGNSIAQSNYVALITDPQIGPDASADKLIEVVDDINTRENISLVVVMGNITANGKFDEFLWAQEILDGLAAPYFVIGGEKDYLLSEGKGNEISLLWGDDKFWFEQDNEVHIGFNDLLPEFNRQNYIDIDTREWIKDNFSKIEETKKVKIFYYSLNEISENLFWLGEGPNIFKNFSIVGELNIDDGSNEVFVSKSLSNQLVWMYNLIISGKDSLIIYNVTKIDSTPSVTFGLSQKDWQYQIPIPSLEGHHIKYKFLSKITLETSIFAKPILLDKKIYICTKSGSVLCLDQSGEEKWRYETNGTIYSSPLVEKDLVVAATNEGDLFTINANNGNLFQVIGIGETITSDITLVDIEHNGMKTKGIVFGTAEGNFYCYELYSLELIWWNNGVKEMINSSVSTAEGKVIFQDKKGTLHCLNSQSGVLLWKWKANTKKINPLFKSDIIVKDNNIYFVDFDGDLHCIDALLGTKKWSIRKIEATGKIELNDKINEIVLHSSKNKILVVSLAKRKVTEEFIFPNETTNEIATSMKLIGSKLIVGFTNGNVYQLVKKQKSKRILWQGYAPIVSISEMETNCLVTDYDGNLTLLDLSKEKK